MLYCGKIIIALPNQGNTMPPVLRWRNRRHLSTVAGWVKRERPL